MKDLRKAAEMAVEGDVRIEVTEPEQRMSVEGSGKLTTKPYPDSYESEQEFRQTLLPVKTYAGGKPNYCTPEVTPEVTPDVDNAYAKNDTKAGVLHKEWVGLTEEEIFQAYKPEMEGMPFNKLTLAVIAGYIEAKLKEKNT